MKVPAEEVASSLTLGGEDLLKLFHHKDPCTGYLDHPFRNKPFETEKNLLPLLANPVGWMYNPKLSRAYSCSYNDIFT